MDETEKAPAPIEIPAERMMAFLAAKNANIECPVCKTKEWTNMEDADNLGFVIHSQSPSGVPGGKILPVMMLVCKNCHYIWAVARRPVEKWIQEHPDGNDQ